VAQSAEASGTDMLGDMRARAIKKAQQKQDSINAVAAKEAQKERLHAMRVAEEVYALIEKNKPRVAYDFFYNKKEFLQKSLTRDAFAMLEGTVKQVVDPRWEADGSEEIAYLAPIIDNKKTAATMPPPSPANPAEANNGKATEIIARVYEALERNDVKSAFQRFDRERAFLKANLDHDAYTILNETVSSAYQSVR
jgi:hypothetical protein